MENIIVELEALRKRILQEVNTEFDRIIELAAKRENMNDRKEYAKPYEMRYPLTAGPNIFKGKKPTGVILGERAPIAVLTWKQVVDEIIQECVKDERYVQALREQCDKVKGKKRTLLSKSKDGMRRPLEIFDDLYMETHYDTETLLNILTTRILGPIGYDFSDISVTIRNA